MEGKTRNEEKNETDWEELPYFQSTVRQVWDLPVMENKEINVSCQEVNWILLKIGQRVAEEE